MTVMEIATRSLLCRLAQGFGRLLHWFMEQSRIRHLPVVAGGRLVGVLSDRDIGDAVGDTVPLERRSVAGGGADRGPASPTAGEMLSKPPITIGPETSVAAAARIMAGGRIGALPIVQDDRLMGMVTETDLLRAFVDAGWEADQEDNLVTTRGDAAYVMDWMAERPESVAPTTTVDKARRLMREHRIRHLPVTDGDRLVGIVSDRDVRRALGRQAATTGAAESISRRRPVSEVMTADPETVDSSALLDEAARRMIRGKIGALPVTEAGKLVGIITETDILNALAGIRQ